MCALEVPVDPDRGFDFQVLDRALEEHNVRVALLSANFHNSLGCVMGTDAKQQLVEMFARRQIPTIEDVQSTLKSYSPFSSPSQI